MDKLKIYRSSSVDWTPAAVIALAASPDGSRVAAAREDGTLEIWLVSPGAVGWHCQLTIHGDAESRVSSLVWCRPAEGSGDLGRLLSSSIDGSISEWDLFSLQQKVILETVGVSIWQMAVEPYNDSLHSVSKDPGTIANGYANHDSLSESQDSDVDDTDDLQSVSTGSGSQRLAVACDDGCLRMYNVSDADGIYYSRSFPRVSGRMLSVAWSLNTKLLFSGSSDGLIRCWDTSSFREVHRITVGLGGLGTEPELCVWSLLYLRCGTLVSGDSSGSVQFWESHHGTLLQAHTYHKGDVNALATVPSNNRVFSAGSDGKVILYKLSNDTSNAEDANKLPTEHINKWVYVGYVRAHTHDVRALTVALPICTEVSLPDEKMPDEKRSKIRPKTTFSYHKWAHLGVPMLISAGDDTKLFAYSAKEFIQFSPHDICPAPQRVSVQLAPNSVLDGAKVMLVQYSAWIDVMIVSAGSNMASNKSSRKSASTQLIARFKSKGSRKIISSAISSIGLLSAYSDHVRPSLFELRRPTTGKSAWSVNKLKLPQGLPYAHCMVFSADNSCLVLAGHDRKIYVVDVKKSLLLHTFVPRRTEEDHKNSPPTEPPITKLFTSSDGQWLAAINCYGDIYVFNLEIDRQHWFIARLNGASVTAGGFPPSTNNVLVITTSSNQVYVFDVESKQLGEWSSRHTFTLPRLFQEFPGEVIGLSFPASTKSTSVVVYSTRAMCLIDFSMPIDKSNEALPNPASKKKEVLPNHASKRKEVLSNGPGLTLEQRKSLIKSSEVKRKRQESNLVDKPSMISASRDPLLFVAHLSEGSLLAIEKRWMDVVKSFDAPVHRHIYGT